MEKYFNASSVRMMRFLYALGFDKESYLDKNGREHWRFLITDNLLEALQFYKEMRKKNNYK